MRTGNSGGTVVLLMVLVAVSGMPRWGACQAWCDERPGGQAGDQATGAAESQKPPLTSEEVQAIRMRQERLLEALPIPEAGAVNALQVHSRRGDALFFLGRFKEAVREYRRMVEISPEVDASHWRLGIALFFANEAQAAADQFQKYHSFDDVDRENGIWRYLCQYQAQGAEVARRELIRYQKDDREPFPAVYRLFEGTLTTDEALQVISDDLPAAERDKRLFYTELYIGMHLVVQKKFDAARQHLHNAVSRQWPRGNGFGPDYMWHVARLQYDLLAEKPAADASAKE